MDTHLEDCRKEGVRKEGANNTYKAWGSTYDKGWWLLIERANNGGTHRLRGDAARQMLSWGPVYNCSVPSPLTYFFSVLATYTRSGHWQKYPFPNRKANLHRLGYSSRHSRYLSNPKSFALQRFLNPPSAHVKFFGHFMPPMISLIFFLCSSFMIPLFN